MDTNLFWCIIGIIGGAVVSFIISYFFYFKGLTKKRLTYEIKTFCIMSDKINQIKGLEVKYNSTQIDNLFSSTITIKNIGNSIIKESDVTPLCPISLSTSGQFLNDKYEYIESHPINKVSNYNLLFHGMGEIQNSVNFIFDYIPKKAIITFSLFHTGDIIFNGDLMEGEIITPAENQRKQKFKRIMWEFFIYILGILFSLIISYFMTHTGGATR